MRYREALIHGSSLASVQTTCLPPTICDIPPNTTHSNQAPRIAFLSQNAMQLCTSLSLPLQGTPIGHLPPAGFSSSGQWYHRWTKETLGREIVIVIVVPSLVSSLLNFFVSCLRVGCRGLPCVIFVWSTWPMLVWVGRVPNIWNGVCCCDCCCCCCWHCYPLLN